MNENACLYLYEMNCMRNTDAKNVEDDEVKRKVLHYSVFIFLYMKYIKKNSSIVFCSSFIEGKNKINHLFRLIIISIHL